MLNYLSEGNVVSSDQVEQPTSVSVNGGSQWQLPHLLGPPRMERDKKDNSVGAFDCCFHPLALQHAENARPFRDLVSTAIDAVEQAYKNQNQPTKLSRTYHVLLGVKYKTGPPQALMVASRVESNFAALLGSVASTRRLLDGVAVWVLYPSIVPVTYPTHWSMSTQVSSDFNGKPPPTNKKKNKEEEEEEARGPVLRRQHPRDLKWHPRGEHLQPAKPLDDQRARAETTGEKANKEAIFERGGDAETVDPLDAPTSIKERGAFDLQNFRIGAGSEADRRPKELVVEVSLEKCATAKGLDLELDQKVLQTEDGPRRHYVVRRQADITLSRRR